MRNMYISEESQSDYMVCTRSNLIELFLFSFSPCFINENLPSPAQKNKKIGTLQSCDFYDQVFKS